MVEAIRASGQPAGDAGDEARNFTSARRQLALPD